MKQKQSAGMTPLLSVQQLNYRFGRQRRPSNDHSHINDNRNPTNKLTEISGLLNINQIKKMPLAKTQALNIF
jgi:hypothetical protein